MYIYTIYREYDVGSCALILLLVLAQAMLITNVLYTFKFQNH